MADKPYDFSQDYEIAVTVLTISGPKDLMQIAYGTGEPRNVIERAIEEIKSDGGIWEDAITFYPISAIIGYRLVEMDGAAKNRLAKIRQKMKEDERRQEQPKPPAPVVHSVTPPGFLRRLLRLG